MKARTATLDDAIEILLWGSEQREQSASLTPAQCAAVLERLEEIENPEMDEEGEKS